MIPRIQSLAEGTLSMAKDRFKQTEIRMQLQILMGYIRYLGTNGSAGLATSTGIRASFVGKYYSKTYRLFKGLKQTHWCARL